MTNDACRFKDESPTPPPPSHRKISVFVIQKETLRKNSDVFKVTCPEETSGSTPRPDVYRVVVLAGIDFVKAAFVTNPRIVEPRTNIVHDIHGLSSDC
jgi:hypothetical protein